MDTDVFLICVFIFCMSGVGSGRYDGVAESGSVNAVLKRLKNHRWTQMDTDVFLIYLCFYFLYQWSWSRKIGWRCGEWIG